MATANSCICNDDNQMKVLYCGHCKDSMVIPMTYEEKINKCLIHKNGPKPAFCSGYAMPLCDKCVSQGFKVAPDRGPFMPRNIYQVFPLCKGVEWKDSESERHGTMDVFYTQKTPRQLEIKLTDSERVWDLEGSAPVHWNVSGGGTLPTDADLFAKLRDSKDSFKVQIKTVPDDSWYKFHFEAHVTMTV